MTLSVSDLPTLRGRLTRLEEEHGALLQLPQSPMRSKALKANFERRRHIKRTIVRLEGLTAEVREDSYLSLVPVVESLNERLKASGSKHIVELHAHPEKRWPIDVSVRRP